MTDETLAATAVIDAPAEAVFDLLADPATHVAIDGTGNVRAPVDTAPLAGAGQVFRMGMYHDGHPNKHYEMSNLVVVFDRPRAIAWQPGAAPRHIPGRTDVDGPVEYGGWTWRYDLAPAEGDRTAVTLTYDWSAVRPEHRDIEFPPFPADHLARSLANLAGLVAQRRA